MLSLATVYRQLKRLNYMNVAGRENIHVTINDAVMHALKTVGDYLFLFSSQMKSFPFSSLRSVLFVIP